MTNSLKILLKTPTWFTIILGLSLLIWQFLGGMISQNVQVMFFAALILLTGIPHGSLDHLVQEVHDKRQNKVYNFVNFTLQYLLIMAIYGLAWYFFSGLSLMVFIIISAWHFGETDLENVPPTAKIWSFTRLIYGLYILAFILLTHVQEVNPIVQGMIAGQDKAITTWNFIRQNTKQILYLFGLLLCTIFIVAQSEHLVVFNKIRIFRLFLILFLSAFLPLLPAFALYFGGWHALCAFDNIHTYLRKDYPSLTLKNVYLKSLPFSILAFIFLAISLWYTRTYVHYYDPYPILFIFISLITLPHLVVTSRMNNNKK